MQKLHSEMPGYDEKMPRKWDRRITIIIVLLLLVPLPFARIESWPGGNILMERLIVPWTGFRLCYISYPEMEPVVEDYSFTWKGELLPRNGSSLLLAYNPFMGEPILKWRNSREIHLNELFTTGGVLRFSSSWQPILLWHAGMLWRTIRNG
jgi:hypothetical protein